MPSEMVPDLAPDEGEQPSPQLPPHVIVATAAVAVATEVLPASQSVQEVALVTALPPPDEIHIPLKPLADAELSDVNVTLRIPVDDLYTFDELRDDPECLRSSVRSDDPHAAVLH